MKKNKLFIIGLVTVFVALLSLTLVSSTFAKYVTTETGTSTARVAKWGVSITSAADTTFAQEYDMEDETVTTITNSVESTTNVVAPGTNGQFAAVTISGTPEVAVKIERKANVTLENWVINTDEFYCPIVITITEGNNKTEINKNSEYDTADELKAAIEEAINVSLTAEPNTNLSSLSNELASIKITWEWAFGGNDAKDTALGNLDNAPTITVEIVTSVTQID